MNTPALRGVCVGAGYFSHFQYEAWDRLPGVEIVALCNRSVERGKAIAERYGIPQVASTEDFASVLDALKPDFVDIITPPETHLDFVRIAAERGITVICQKPLAPTWAETCELAELVRASGIRFMVHENWRWQPWYRQIAAELKAGTLGEFFHCAVECRLGDGWGDDAYLARQPFFRDYPRLFIFETGVHFLDTFRFLFGEVRSIYARIARRNPVIRGEDAALLVCEFANGKTAVLDANRYNESAAENPRYTFGRIRLEGSQGHLELDFDGSLRRKPLGQAYENIPYSPSEKGFAGDCVHALQQHFVDAMRTSTDFESTAEDYLRTVCLVEAAYASAHSGKVVELASFDPA